MNEQDSNRGQQFIQTHFTVWLAIVTLALAIASISLDDLVRVSATMILTIVGLLYLTVSSWYTYELQRIQTENDELATQSAQNATLDEIQRVSESNTQRIDTLEDFIQYVSHEPISEYVALLKITNAQRAEIATIYRFVLSDFKMLKPEIKVDIQNLESSTTTEEYVLLQLQKASEIDILLDYYDCIVNYFRGQCDDLLEQNPPDKAIFSDLSFRPNRQLIQLIHDITIADRSSENLSRSSDITPQSDENDDIQPNIIDDDEQNQQGTS